MSRVCDDGATTSMHMHSCYMSPHLPNTRKLKHCTLVSIVQPGSVGAHATGYCSTDHGDTSEVQWHQSIVHRPGGRLPVMCIAGDVAGFKHVQLELFRAAAQDLLARLAPDLLAHLLAIFRAYARVPPTADQHQLHVGGMAQHGHSSVATSDPDHVTGMAGGVSSAVLVKGTGVRRAGREQDHSAVVMAADGAAAPEAFSPAQNVSGLLSASALSQMGFEPIAAVTQPRQSLVSFSDMASPASFSSAHSPPGRPTRPSQLPTILSMVPIEDVPAGSVSPSVHLTGQETPRSIASVRAQAGQMQQQMVQDARHGHLVVLQPQQTVQQSSHVLVMQGSVQLEGCAVNTQLAPGLLWPHPSRRS